LDLRPLRDGNLHWALVVRGLGPARQ